MYTIITEQSFDSAHFLAGYTGKCRNIHGHRWRVIIEVGSTSLAEDGQMRGMVTDFKEFKADLNEIVDFLDHALIVETGSLKESTVKAFDDEGFRLVFVDFRPTAENFAKYFYNKMKEKGYYVIKSTVFETPDNCASYCE